MTFSWTIFLLMLAMLGATLWVFLHHTQRDTRERETLRLFEWARSRRLRSLRRSVARQFTLGPLAPLFAKGTVVAGFAGGALSVVKLRLAHERANPREVPNEGNLAEPSDTPKYAHLFIQKVDRISPAVALRESSAIFSLLDRMDLDVSIHQPAGQRLMVLGTDSLACLDLAESALVQTLPAGVSLLRAGPYVVIDFSKAPFDEIAIERARVLAASVSASL